LRDVGGGHGRHGKGRILAGLLAAIRCFGEAKIDGQLARHDAS